VEPLRDLEGEAAEACAEDDVRAWIEEDEALASELEALNGVRGGIDRALSDAARGHVLGDALAAVAAAEQELQDGRTRAAEDLCARLLLDEARSQRDRSQPPPALKAARERFERFTHHGWRIDLGLDGAFRAHDVAQDAERSLDELSDGTRAQLLLAARLAALESNEGPLGPFPLCLDEALSTTDPKRFDAVAAALFEEVDRGRQVIYLTADPSEARQWEDACERLGREGLLRVVDLGALRGLAASWGDDVSVVTPAATAFPDPAGHDADTYARALGVGLPDGFGPVDGWHLVFALQDELPTLVGCLERRITTMGTWTAARDSELLRRVVPPEVGRRADARIELARAVAEAWRVGRGRPVTWADVVASNAVTEKRADDVREALEVHGRDAAAFVAAVREIPRFLSRMATDLETHLEAIGALDRNEPLAADALIHRALERCPGAVEALGASEAAAHVDWLVGLLDAREEAEVAASAQAEV